MSEGTSTKIIGAAFNLGDDRVIFSHRSLLDVMDNSLAI
jgi:hypothetical protein